MVFCSYEKHRRVSIPDFQGGIFVEEKLREYAHLIVSAGLNLQKGQTLILSSPAAVRVGGL